MNPMTSQTTVQTQKQSQPTAQNPTPIQTQTDTETTGRIMTAQPHTDRSTSPSSATQPAPKSASTPLKQLHDLVQEVQQPRLRQMLGSVLGEATLQGEILAAHFASLRDPVQLEPVVMPDGRARFDLGYLADFDADPKAEVGRPNIAQLQLVARMARDTGLTYPFEREMLYVAAVLQGLVVIGVRHQGLSLDDARDAMRVRVRRPLGALEDEYPVMGWQLRQALGLGTEEDQSSEEGQRYASLVSHAWLRADRTLAWRRHVTTAVAVAMVGKVTEGTATEGESDQPAQATDAGSPAADVQPKRAGSFATNASPQRLQLARQRAGWSMEDRYGSGRWRDVGAQARAEGLAFLQANPSAWGVEGKAG